MRVSRSCLGGTGIIRYRNFLSTVNSSEHKDKRVVGILICPIFTRPFETDDFFFLPSTEALTLKTPHPTSRYKICPQRLSSDLQTLLSTTSSLPWSQSRDEYFAELFSEYLVMVKAKLNISIYELEQIFCRWIYILFFRLGCIFCHFWVYLHFLKTSPQNVD